VQDDGERAAEPSVQAVRSGLLSGDLDFAGRRVLVTGAAGGLGRAMAEGFASHGAALVLADVDAEGVRAVAATIGAGTTWHAYDQGDPESVERVADAAGPVDVLVNNAGILLFKPLLESSAAEIRSVLDVNVMGVIVLARAVARGMIARGGGVIVNVGSQLAFCGGEQRGVYAASKAAVSQFTRTAAVEWGGSGVRVVCMAPGRTVTPLNDAVRRDERDRGIARIALGRYGRPDEAAKLAIFLASPAASYITGETVIADGGFVIG
jgi:NAD(P)-dependent dehydrogenase (short-subunit alcohol dehydrogenase family)